MSRDWEKRPLTGAEHIAADMRAGRFPNRSDEETVKREIEAREESEGRAADVAKIHGVRHVYVGLSYGALAIKWGPYPPDVAGGFMEGLLQADPDKKFPVFFSVECEAVDDPISTILGWCSEEAPSAEATA